MITKAATIKVRSNASGVVRLKAFLILTVRSGSATIILTSIKSPTRQGQRIIANIMSTPWKFVTLVGK